MLQEEFGVLVLGSVVRVGVHDELRVRQPLRQDERVDRQDHDVLGAVYDQGRVLDLLQGGVAVTRWHRPPFPNRVQLRLGRPRRDRPVPVACPRREALQVRPPSLLTRVGG